MKRHLITSIAIAALLARPASGVMLVKDGKAVAIIIIPGSRCRWNPMRRTNCNIILKFRRARVCRSFLKTAGGRPAARVYLGNCLAAALGQLDSPKLPATATS